MFNYTSPWPCYPYTMQLPKEYPTGSARYTPKRSQKIKNKKNKCKRKGR